MSNDLTNFTYLNRDNRWPAFQWEGLELRSDGALQLFSVPLLEGDLPSEIENLAAPSGPAGIAVDIDGTIYYSDPDAHRLLKIDGCDSKLGSVPCIGGKDGKPTQLNMPRGLLIPPHRRSLFVADSGNHRIQILDIASLQLVDIWGQADAAGPPRPSSEPGRFNIPWTLTADAAGNVYVADYGNQRLQKFNALGQVVSIFWDNVKTYLRCPSDIAASVAGDKTHLYILARDANAVWKVFVSDAEGHPVLDDTGAPITFGGGHLQKPMSIAASEAAVYVGDNDKRSVFVFKRDDFKRDGSFIFSGEVVGYQGPIAALALDGRGGLLVHAGTDLAPVRLAINHGYRTDGLLWSPQPIKVGEAKVSWHRLQAQLKNLAPNAHLQFFVYITDDDQANPPKPDPRSPDSSPWRRIALDVTDLFIGGDPACCLWIAAHFTSNGRVTPVVSQMRVEFDQETYLVHLPAIFSNGAVSRQFLVRFLSLFESFFSETESQIAGLPALFDPNAAPKEFLSWLAGWLALELNENWDEGVQRQTIAKAFEMYGKRGTAEGLREALRLFAGVHTIIQEPILNAAWWSLPAYEEAKCKACEDATDKSWRGTENSILGFTTMLAPAQAQGAVVGTTAILDQSHLIPGEEFGAPLFTDVAHQFSALTYRGELKCQETLVKVRAVIEREKPAHTHYHLCIVEPRMRVGFQARVGIDTVVSGPPLAVKLGEVPGFGPYLTLGGRPPARLGDQSHIGLTARIG